MAASVAAPGAPVGALQPGRRLDPHDVLPGDDHELLVDERDAARLRISRRGAQSRLHLGGWRAANGRKRAGQISPAPALRHQLLDDRDAGVDHRLLGG